MQADLLIPAPATWRNLRPTDTPVLRNDLWDAYRSITRGAWVLAIYGDRHTLRLVSTLDCVVDDFGQLQPLGDAAKAAAAAWYASTFTIDAAASDWMGQFNDPLPAGTPLRVMADQARALRQPQPSMAGQVQAHVLPQPRSAWYAASVCIDDDLSWRHPEPLVSIEVQHDEQDRLVLTHRQARALGALLRTIDNSQQETQR